MADGAMLANLTCAAAAATCQQHDSEASDRGHNSTVRRCGLSDKKHCQLTTPCINSDKTNDHKDRLKLTGIFSPCWARFPAHTWAKTGSAVAGTAEGAATALSVVDRISLKLENGLQGNFAKSLILGQGNRDRLGEDAIWGGKRQGH